MLFRRRKNLGFWERVKFFFWPRKAIVFEHYPYTAKLEHENLSAYLKRHCGDFDRAYLIVRDWYGKDRVAWRRAFGPFVAAVTSGDNSNILTARVARETFGLDRVVARIYDPRRAVIYERLGIPTIATVQWSIDRVLRRLLPDAAETDWIDPSARVVLIERPVAASWAGRPLSEIELPGVSRTVAVSRMGTSQIATPDLVTQDGDVVYLAVAVGRIEDVDKHLAGSTAAAHG